MTDDEIDVAEQRERIVLFALKKAWRDQPAADSHAVYLLGVAGQLDGPLLGYDFGEFAAFLGGVYDGEFMLDSPAANPPPLAPPAPGGPTDWAAAPLPPSVTPDDVSAAFTAVVDDLDWVVFGGDGGLAWARATFTLPSGDTDSRKRITASAHPALTVAEIREIARLPWPLPRGQNR